jgi:hypothetical protein
MVVGVFSGPEGTFLGQGSSTLVSVTNWAPELIIDGGFASQIFGRDPSGVTAFLWNQATGFTHFSPPDGYLKTEIYASDGNRQVGTVLKPMPYTPSWGMTHAAMWSGSTNTFVDLHPDGAGDNSWLYAVQGEYQGGAVAGWYGMNPRPAIWRGTPESVVFLVPEPRVSQGEVTGIAHPYQAGNQIFSTNGTAKAWLWKGSHLLSVDLHQYFDQNIYAASQAKGIWTDGETIHIVGVAWNDPVPRHLHTILWTIRGDPFSPKLKLTVSGQVGSSVVMSLTYKAMSPLPVLQSSDSPSGPWEDTGIAGSLENDSVTATLTNSASQKFFRLR